MAKSEWARGSNQYVKRPRPADRTADRDATISLNLSDDNRDDTQRRAATGIRWDRSRLNFDLLALTTPDRARRRLRATVPSFIWDAAALEGNTYTLPEVQTLLEGTTVGGRPVDDAEQILALRDAFTLLDRLVANGSFRLDKATSDAMHRTVALHEAIESGHFRGEGRVGGGGTVNLGGAGLYRASPPGEGGKILLAEHRTLLGHLDTLEDPREQAIVYFCAAARRQLYFDGNKRTARLMMSGHLMANGFDAISVSAVRRIEFNSHLSTLFDSGNATDLMAFIIDSRPRDAEQPRRA